VISKRPASARSEVDLFASSAFYLTKGFPTGKAAKLGVGIHLKLDIAALKLVFFMSFLCCLRIYCL